jgi:hypothetical protein
MRGGSVLRRRATGWVRLLRRILRRFDGTLEVGIRHLEVALCRDRCVLERWVCGKLYLCRLVDMLHRGYRR